MRTRLGNRGFTLIELMTVVVIIAILSGFILKSLSASRARARDAQRISDLSQLQLALALYQDRCGQYPSTLTVATANGCAATSPVTNFGTFIGKIPVPPGGANQAAYDYAILNNASGVPINYVLHADLEYNNVSVGRGLNAASIPQNGGTWSPSTNVSPYNTCSNAGTSVDYCVGP